MNIVLRELRANMKALIIWCVMQVFLIYVGMLKYAGMAEAGNSVNDLLAGLPEIFKTMFGLSTFDLTHVGGYYGVFFLYFILLGSIHAVMLGAVIISKEERDKTADFLLTKPVSRVRIITSKLVAALINIVAFNLTTLIASIIIVDMYNQGQSITGDIIKLMIALFIIQLIFLSVGVGTAVMTRNTKKATSVSTAVLLITFILSMAIDMYSKIENLKYLTPFKYFEARQLMFGGQFEAVFIVLSALIVIVLVTVTYIFYKKRDMQV